MSLDKCRAKWREIADQLEHETDYDRIVTLMSQLNALILEDQRKRVYERLLTGKPKNTPAMKTTSVGSEKT